jgi:RNA polymerase sigma-70 factor (ECF subfamily)
MSWDEVALLVHRAQAGERRAFGELVERFRSAVFAVAVGRLRNEAEAQELVQDVFMHVMRKLTQLRDPRCFAGWLRQITVRMAINRLTRGGAVFGSEPEMLDAVAGAASSPLEELERGEDRREVHAGLARLKPLDRETLEAFYLRGRTLKQMSREFETPVGTIKRRLHVARLRLKEALEALEARAEPAGSARLPRRRRMLDAELTAV